MLKWCNYVIFVAPRSATDRSDYFAYWGSRQVKNDSSKVVTLKPDQTVKIALYVKVFGDTEVEANETFEVRILEARDACPREDRHIKGCGVYQWWWPAFRGGTIVNDDSA